VRPDRIDAAAHHLLSQGANQMGEATARRQLVAVALADYPAEIGHWLWALEDSRQRTLRALAGIPAAVIDFTTPCIDNTIGTLLYHIAAIEADWLFCEVLQEEFPPAIVRLFPYEVRDETGRLSVVQGVSLAEHLARLAHVRTTLIEAFRTISLADFYRVRALDAYDVTPAWVLHHLCQHEAEHRGQILETRRLAEALRK
jgi:uncharacterized damage-inducible protein DinB